MSNHPLSEVFPIGSRVIPSDHGRETSISANRPGIVVGYGREPHLLRVRLDGKKSHTTYHVDFWQPKTPVQEEATYRVPISRFPPVPLPRT